MRIKEGLGKLEVRLCCGAGDFKSEAGTREELPRHRNGSHDSKEAVMANRIGTKNASASAGARSEM